jgi:hypothetical protein
MRYLKIVIIIVCIVALTGFQGNSHNPYNYYDPRPCCKKAVSGGCAIGGQGHENADPSNEYLNSLKNRDITPKEDSYIHTDLQRIMADLPQKIGNSSSRENWENEIWLKAAAKYEKNAVAIYGYLDSIHIQDVEECNCYLPVDKDYHIWMGNKKNGNVGNNWRHDMVVELSPRLKSKQKDWHDKVEKIVHHRDSVRVSGWLMFDNEHYRNLLPVKETYTAKDYKYKTRITLWEVHPIHKIEVWKNGKWKGIDEVY